MFINNKQFTELYKASVNGDDKAKAIMQKFRESDDEGAVSRLIDDYFGLSNEAEDTSVENVPAEEDTTEIVVKDPEPETVVQMEPADMVGDPDGVKQENFFEKLDGELDGCIDEPDVKDCTFDEFMERKHRDTLRGRKNHDYFSAFDPVERANYSAMRKDRFDHSFDTRRRDIERSFNDMDGAISTYIQYVSDQPDDKVDTDVNVAGNAYDDILSSVGKSHSFGRGWDENDLNEVKEQLSELMGRYGRSNVIAALNILKGDNAAYRDFRNGAIDQAVKNYGGELDKLLK